MKDSCEIAFKIESEPFSSVYEVSSEIGRGKFAVVKRCKHKSTSVEYAAKFIRKRRKGTDCRKDALHEIRMLQSTVTHPNFVHLVEVYETNHEMILVTELARGGELFQYITTEGQVDEMTTVALMKEILTGLAFLHDQNIAHLDIKPQNILLTESSLPECSIKLCDLGLARIFDKGEDLFEIIGTPDYVAPEILDYQKLNAACDMWSIGVLAYVMLSGCSPFAGDNIQETFLNISQVNLDFPDELFKSTSAEAIDFMRRLLLKEPESRLTAKECLDHPWLNAGSGRTIDRGSPISHLDEEDHQQATNDIKVSNDICKQQQPFGGDANGFFPTTNRATDDADEKIPLSETDLPPEKPQRIPKTSLALHELQNVELIPQPPATTSPTKKIWSDTSENWEPSGVSV